MKIYVASKLRHADYWKQLAAGSLRNFTINSRWLWLRVGRCDDDLIYAKLFWQENIEDVSAADVVLVYAEPDDILRGALVEAGAAIALGIPVIAVGDNPSYGTWVGHPLVYQVETMAQAVNIITMMEESQF